MKPEPADATWEQMKPFLDEGMAQLGEKDRNAVLLRYFQDKSLKDVGAAIGTSERAAQKRVARAIEKLRVFFTKRGVVLRAMVITTALSVNAVQAAPAGMASIAVSAAMKGGATSASTATLIKATLKLMFWAKAQMAIVVSVGVALAAVTTTVVVKDLTREKPPSVEILSPEDAFLTSEISAHTWQAPPALIVRTTHFPTNIYARFYVNSDRIAYAAGRNTTFAAMMEAAYQINPERMVFPHNAPTNHFDFLITLPNCPNKTFQTAITTNSGWTAHKEMLETNVLLLKVKSAEAPGLRPGTTLPAYGSIRWEQGDGVYRATNCLISDFRLFLEHDILKQPVIDQTGLTNKFDIVIKWKTFNLEPGMSKRDALNKALLDQLGLELVPGRERIEMLIVEQVKTASHK